MARDDAASAAPISSSVVTIRGITSVSSLRCHISLMAPTSSTLAPMAASIETGKHGPSHQVRAARRLS